MLGSDLEGKVGNSEDRIVTGLPSLLAVRV